MQISSTKNFSQIRNLSLKGQSKETRAKTESPESSGAASDSVNISYSEDAAKAEGKKLWDRSKVGGVIGLAVGAAAGVAAGLVGGVAGTLVGLAVAPAGAVVGGIAGAVGGFMAVANRKNTHVGHLIGGLLLGSLGALAVGSAGFHGAGLLGAAAGGAGGAMGAIAGAIGGSTIGGILGGIGVAGYELGANTEQYPNLLAQLKEEAAKDAEKKKLEEAEHKEFKAELKQKLKDAFK